MVHSKILDLATTGPFPHRLIGEVPLRGKKDLTPLTELLVAVDDVELRAKKASEGSLTRGVTALNALDHEAARQAFEEAIGLSKEDTVVEYFSKLAQGRRRDEYSRADDG